MIPTKCRANACHRVTVTLQAVAAHSKVGKHPKIVTLIGAYEDQNFVYILLELCPEICLFSTADVEKGYTKSEQVVKQQAFQLLSAIAYCHKQGKICLYPELGLSCSHTADTHAVLQECAIATSVATLFG